MQALSSDIKAIINDYDKEIKTNAQGNELIDSGLLELNNNGAVKQTYKNVCTILEQDTNLKDLVRFNEFTFENDVTRDIPKLDIYKGVESDQIHNSIIIYLSNEYSINLTIDMFVRSLHAMAFKHRYNPLKDYLEQSYKEWLKDGKKEYIADMLPTYLGVTKSETTILASKLFLVGGVAKVYQPLTQFDYVLDLVGEQGTGKTKFLKKIANGYYTDQFTNFYDKDSYSTMLKALIVNDDELTASNSVDFASLKKFVTAETLEYRKPYAHNTIKRPKNFILARTTNEVTYLKDKTGARRFLPCKVDAAHKKIDVADMTSKQVALLWGQACAIYKEHGDKYFILNEEQRKLLADNRLSFEYIDETENQIQIALDTIRANKKDFVTSKMIADAVGENNLIKNKKLASKIKYVMDNNNDYRAGSKRINGTSYRGWRCCKITK